MGDERGRATGEAEGDGCGALAWKYTSGDGGNVVTSSRVSGRDGFPG